MNTTMFSGFNDDDDAQKTFDRLYKHLTALAKEKNPATGKSYLYVEPGKANAFVEYTRFPKMKECRGQILIISDDDRMSGLHYDVAGKVKSEGENKCYSPEKIDRVKKFYQTNTAKYLTNLNDHFDFMYSVGTTTSGPDENYYEQEKRPVDLAEEVHEGLFGEGKIFNEKGRYFGWVRLDGADHATTRAIWASNYFEEMEFCTVTVGTGLPLASASATRTYSVLKGTKITIPDCIYAYNEEGLGANFSGWLMEGSFGKKNCMPGQTVNVSEDLNFTAQWAYDNTTIQVVWQDGDDANGFRPKENTGYDCLRVAISTDTAGSGAYTVALRPEENFTAVIPDLALGDPVAKLESKSTCKLYSVDVPIKLTAKIPETLQKADRTFYVLSCHNGNVTAAAQGTGSELTWKTDKFSTYLIAYSDPKIKSVTLSKTSFGYNGKVQKPTVTVKDSTGKTVDKKYYTVTYSDKNSKKCGTYKVTVKFTGKYSGSKTLQYKIVKGTNTFTKVTASKNIRLSQLKKKDQTFTIAATVKEKAKKTFKLKSVPKKAKKYISVSKAGKVTVKKGLKAGTYKIRVQITAAKTKNYKKTTVTKTIKIVVK